MTNRPQPTDPGDQALARSLRLQEKLIDVLNQPGDRWGEEPLCAAHAIAEILSAILRIIVHLDPSRVPWALEMCDTLRSRVTDGALLAALPVSERAH